uniref:Putative neuropeptide receptor n=1 Tax=Cupiennius salei TaxID=6928 RepID=T1D203_CUPSA
MNDELCEQELRNRSAEFENYSFHEELYPGEPTVWKELYFADVLKLFAYIVIIAGGLLGNISVILTVALNRSMRTTINFYVANLAVADAMICIICMVPHALTVTTENAYILGEFMCKFNPFTQMTCLTSSVLTLSAISCDRFMAIMFPLHVRITKQRTSVVMTIVWIVSVAVSVPFLFVKKHLVIQWKNFLEPKCSEVWYNHAYYEESVQDCVTYEPLRVIYYVVVSITLFFLPIVIMITAYSLILWRLWGAEVPGEQHAANVNVHSRARKKVNKMVFVVLVVFIICWTPLQAMVLYSAFGHNATIHGALPDWFGDFKWFSYYIAYANSFMNPIIYGGFNKTFREGFCIVLRCGYQRDRYGRPARSRLTFTTGVTSSPSRKTLNGANRSSSQKSNIEMKLVYGDTSPTMKETCVSIAETKETFA